MFEPRRPYLVFSSVDEGRALLVEGLGSEDRQFDLVIYVYNGSIDKFDRETVDYCVSHPGYKFQNFYHFSQNCDISKYSAIWLVDEDVIISTYDINRMFNVFMENELQIAQPAYDRLFNWELCLADENFSLRYTNFVENGVAILARTAVECCLETMRYSKSGWGLDFIWPKLCGFPFQGIAIIDEVVLQCPPVPSAIDKTMQRNERETEGRQLMQTFGATFFVPRVTGGIPIK